MAQAMKTGKLESEATLNLLRHVDDDITESLALHVKKLVEDANSCRNQTSLDTATCATILEHVFDSQEVQHGSLYHPRATGSWPVQQDLHLRDRRVLSMGRRMPQQPRSSSLASQTNA